MSYIDVLTPQERERLIKVGMLYGLASTSNTINDFEKKAQHLLESVGGGLKMALTAALLAGVPAGVMLHLIDRHSSNRRRNERELQERLKFYRNLTTGVESELVEPNSQSPGIPEQPKVITSV